jgi:amino acid permease
MFRNDNIWLGIIVGLIIPFVGYAIIQTLFEGLASLSEATGGRLSDNFRERTLGVLAICLNIIPLQIFQRRKHYQSIRGLIFPTVAYAILWVVLFGKDVL